MNPGVGVHLTEPDGDQYWVREAPVSPLPTEPGTVIAIGDWWLVRLRPYYRDETESTSWELLPSPKDVSIALYERGVKDQCIYSDEWVRVEAAQHGGFEVLASPRWVMVEVGEERDAEVRRETAKAVLDRVMITGISGPAVDGLYREFGVSS